MKTGCEWRKTRKKRKGWKINTKNNDTKEKERKKNERNIKEEN